MPLSLPASSADLASAKGERGLQQTASEVLSDAMRLLEEGNKRQTLHQETLRRDLQEGLASGPPTLLNMEKIKARGRTQLVAQSNPV
ncbi:MAG: type II toxin-antitoxin system ParD family antitoxin [Magnetococcales bacterium]|nr:type II toxin-antitoxin system ParD family antitoxin [Magnetococcales bacterium]